MQPPTNYVILLLASAVISATSGIYTWHRKRAERVKDMTGPLLLLNGSVWSMSYALELLATHLPSKLFWIKIQYASITLIGTGWLLYSLHNIGLSRKLKRRTLRLLSILPIAFIALITTNEHHELVFATKTLSSIGQLPSVQVENKIGFMLLLCYSVALISIASYLSLIRLTNASRLNSRQQKAVLITAIIPWIGILAVIFEIYTKGLLFTPLMFNLIGVTLVILDPYKIRVRDIIPLARESVYDYMRDFVLILDENDEVVDANPAAQQLFGGTSTELAGHSVKHLFRERLNAPFNINEMREGQEVQSRKDDEERTYDVTVSTLDNGSDWFRGNILVLHDITAQRRAQTYWEEQQRLYSNYLERQVEERTRRLRNAERMATIGELASMIGHDLRNPLTGIMGAVYYLKKEEGIDINENKEKMYKIIEQNIEASDNIIKDLLDYSRELKLELKETNLRQLTEDAAFSVAIPDDVKISNQTDDELTVVVDSPKIKRVLINLLQNAIDAMPKGGSITITSKETHPDLELSVSDTGAGIPEEIMNRIWEPLFTTKPKGMGFGLAICKKIVEAHGGSITVDSEVGLDTVFTIKLSLVQDGDVSSQTSLPDVLQIGSIEKTA